MFKKNKIWFVLILAGAIFIGLVLFNYLKAQSAIKDTKPAPLAIELVSFPEKILAGSAGTFIWSISASPDLSTPYTTIYWGYESSPSALTKTDSPDAVRYPNSEEDYAHGNFRLPDTFDVNVVFNKPGKIWFRAYANVRGEHLWSEEKFLNVEK